MLTYLRSTDTLAALCVSFSIRPRGAAGSDPGEGAPVWGRGPTGGRASKPRAHARADLRERERFSDVVGVAGGERLRHIVLPCASGQDDEGGLLVTLRRAEPAACLEPVEA